MIEYRFRSRLTGEDISVENVKKIFSNAHLLQIECEIDWFERLCARLYCIQYVCNICDFTFLEIADRMYNERMRRATKSLHIRFTIHVKGVTP